MPCLRGAQLVHQIIHQNDTDVLRGAIIWLPMLKADNLDAADQRERGFSDPRLAQYWDADRKFGRLIARTLDLKAAIAWDVYLVYPAGVTWHAQLPPAPAVWMHQLDEESGPRLDALALSQYTQALLERNSPQ